MKMKYKITKLVIIVLFLGYSFNCFSQFKPKEFYWTTDGNGYLRIQDGNILETDMKSYKESILIKRDQLIPAGKSEPLSFNIYSFSANKNILLIYTNTAKVWRYKTRGDYWVFDMASKKLIQLGKGRPSQSLMFAKISPDEKKAAYVSGHNIK